MQEYINIYKKASKNGKQVSVLHPFFRDKEDIVAHIFHDHITFTKPTLDYRGRTHKPCKADSDWLFFCIYDPNDYVPLGRLMISEDSTEDEIVINIER